MSDLISRQVVLEILLKNSLFNAYGMIVHLPSAQPEQKKGEWIKCGYWSEGVGMGETHGSCYKCSECGIEVQAGEEKCGMNFCYNCGAKMKEEVDDE